MKKMFLVLTIAFMLISCDPYQDLLLINNTDHAAKVILKVAGEPKSYELEELVTGDSIVFNLNPDSVRVIHIGMGDWNDEAIQLFASDVKSLSIKTRDKTIIYENESQLKELLTENRRGFFIKSDVNIDIED